LRTRAADKIVSINPAGKLGKFIPRDDKTFEVTPQSREELETFLTGTQQVCPDQHALFLTLARSGMRLGEVLALKWATYSSATARRQRNNPQPPATRDRTGER